MLGPPEPGGRCMKASPDPRSYCTTKLVVPRDSRSPTATVIVTSYVPVPAPWGRVIGTALVKVPPCRVNSVVGFATGAPLWRTSRVSRTATDRSAWGVNTVYVATRFTVPPRLTGFGVALGRVIGRGLCCFRPRPVLAVEVVADRPAGQPAQQPADDNARCPFPDEAAQHRTPGGAHARSNRCLRVHLDRLA